MIRCSRSFASGCRPQQGKDIALTVALLEIIALGTGVATIALALATRYGDLQRVDDALEAWIGPQRTQLHGVATAASLLGEKGVHTIIAGIVALVLYRQFGGPALRFFLPMACATLGGITAHQMVKFIYRRARPRVALDRNKTEPAFPSGHTTNCTAVLVTSAFLISHTGLTAPAFIGTIVVVLALLTGMSRVALGWHWGSDVVGGWLTGVCVACLAVALFLTIS